MKKAAPLQAPAAACVQSTKAAWPQGATAGLLLVALSCAALSLTLYHLAAPREPFVQQ